MKKIKITFRKKEQSLDIQQEYDVLKALHRALGKKIKLEDLESIKYKKYASYIHLTSDKLDIDKKLPNNVLINEFKIYPSVLMDFLYYNGAVSENPSDKYRPMSKPAKKPQAGTTKWARDSMGFWKQVPA